MKHVARWLWLATFSGSLAYPMAVTATPSVVGPVQVGTVVKFSAAVQDAAPGTVWYRFRVRPAGSDFYMVRDFGPLTALDWTASDSDGWYDFEVTARNLTTGDLAVTTLSYFFRSAVIGGQPAVSPTANSLVFLFSAPPCDPSMRMRVVFAQGHVPNSRDRRTTATQGPGGTPQYTAYKNCHDGTSMNFYLAGMAANTTYAAHAILDTGSAFIAGADVSFTTGDLPGGLYTDTVLVPNQVPVTNPVLLTSPLGVRPLAHDLAGNVIWYGPTEISLLTRPIVGGDMWGLIELQNADPSQQAVRRFDLAGNVVAETNAARVNEQLRAMGKRQISAFHHEARSISGNRVAVLADVEQILSDVQGAGPVDIVGDMVIVLDQDMNVIWAWDTFDHLDVHRVAILNEKCPGACPPIQLSKTGNDWTHGNSLQETQDGNLLYSTRHQDWLIKIAYDGGVGDGHIIWKLGVDGSFHMNSSDPFPWFSHQHDANFESTDPTKLLVFDDGNTRVAQQNGGNSRGQVLQLEEQTLTASLVLNADLGVYAAAVGSAQTLRDGNYHFDAGFVQENNTIDSYSYEIDPSGKVVYSMHQNAILYRTFRMMDMYTPEWR